MIAYAFLQHCRLATARREKMNQWAASLNRRLRRKTNRPLTWRPHRGKRFGASKAMLDHRLAA
jgi:hypothetical protein